MVLLAQAGWQTGDSEWRLPAEEHRFWKSVLSIRSEVNGVCHAVQ